jgi:hypothetical protein
MQVPMIRTVAVLLFATASAAYAAGGTPTASRVNAGTLPLSVDMECPSFAGGVYTCQAYPSGGSGTGYSFTWSSSNGYAWETYDADGYSEADAACYGGLGQGSTSIVTATVTDSNSATASKSRIINCGY